VLVVYRAPIIAGVAVALACCGGGSGGPHAASAPAPTPTPAPAGTVRFLQATLRAGSSVAVAPMFVSGQQAPQLTFAADITLRTTLLGALVRAWVRTDTQRCMGGGRVPVNFQADVEQTVAPASMSHPGYGMPLCALPYTTTQVEFEVFDVDTQRPILEVRLPAVYHFVAE
jgi:hypothetical protein